MLLALRSKLRDVAAPNATEPPPASPLPAETVTDELARLALVMPADPDKLAFVKPEIVFEPAAIVAPVIDPSPTILTVGVFK